MTYDAARGYTLLHGGYGGGSSTWKWNGVAWTNANTNPSPTLTRHAMVNDSDRQRVVMFSWGGTRGRSGDTWTYDGGDWTLAAPSSIPLARSESAAMFDPTTNAILMFGGAARHNAALVDTFDDTWEFDGSRWRALTPETSPSKRGGHVLVFDSVRAEGVLFGGHTTPDRFDGHLGDTWTWSGGNWHLASPQQSPPARSNASAAFDPSRGYVVLFGGVGPNG